ncbi:hypothetical protein WJX75_000520 [Coccomyxa subellipsoidea]|uniref:Uncharacterized protein n=1 Tax=Coccomyxa subellipsoidea TaxID=248742 RepID=A0ABR2YCU1_9CHLO
MLHPDRVKAKEGGPLPCLHFLSLSGRGEVVCQVDEAPSTSFRTRSLLGCAGLGGCLAAIDPGPAVNHYVTSTADQFSSAQQSLGTGITDVFKGDPNESAQ